MGTHLPQKGAVQLPNFRPMRIVAKRLDLGWIKMPLGMEVGLGPGKYIHNLECGRMPNVMATLPNIDGAICSTPQSLADAHY